MKILTDKKHQEFVKSVIKRIECEYATVRCKEGIHHFEPIYNRVRNNYQPEYMGGGLSASLHNSSERSLMFDSVYVKSICKFCGFSLLKNN